MRGYLGRFFDNKFQPKLRNKGCHRNSFGTPKLSTVDKTKQTKQQASSSSALVPNQGKAFKTPVNDCQFVIHEDSTDIEHEAVQPTQEELIQGLKEIVDQNDTDKIFIDDALRSQLEPIKYQLGTISDLAKPKTNKPKYL